jgi:hypothetical protein
MGSLTFARAWELARIRSCADCVSSSEAEGGWAMAMVGIAAVAANVRASLRRVTSMGPLYELSAVGQFHVVKRGRLRAHLPGTTCYGRRQGVWRLCCRESRPPRKVPHFETQLDAFAESMGTKLKSNLRLRDMAGKGVERAANYLTLVLSIPVKTDPAWSRLKDLHSLRNIIVHRAARKFLPHRGRQHRRSDRGIGKRLRTDGLIWSERFQCGFLHHCARGGLAGPDFELARGLLQKHFEPLDHFSALVLRSTNQLGFERIVDHVEHQFRGDAAIEKALVDARRHP